jgi:hypothetical protein
MADTVREDAATSDKALGTLTGKLTELIKILKERESKEVKDEKAAGPPEDKAKTRMNQRDISFAMLTSMDKLVDATTAQLEMQEDARLDAEAEKSKKDKGPKVESSAAKVPEGKKEKKGILDIMSTIIEGVGKMINFILKAFENVITFIIKTVGEIGTAIGKLGAGIGKGIGGLIGGLLEGIGHGLQALAKVPPQAILVFAAVIGVLVLAFWGIVAVIKFGGKELNDFVDIVGNQFVKMIKSIKGFSLTDVVALVALGPALIFLAQGLYAITPALIVFAVAMKLLSKLNIVSNESAEGAFTPLVAIIKAIDRMIDFKTMAGGVGKLLLLVPAIGALIILTPLMIQMVPSYIALMGLALFGWAIEKSGISVATAFYPIIDIVKSLNNAIPVKAFLEAAIKFPMLVIIAGILVASAPILALSAAAYTLLLPLALFGWGMKKLGISVGTAFYPLIDIAKSIGDVPLKVMAEGILKFPLIMLLAGMLSFSVQILYSATIAYAALLPLALFGWGIKKLGISVSYAFQPIIDIAKSISDIKLKDMAEAIIKFPLVMILAGILVLAVPTLYLANGSYAALLPLALFGLGLQKAGISVSYAFQPIIDIAKSISAIKLKDMAEAILKFPLVMILAGILGLAVPTLYVAATAYTLLLPLALFGWGMQKLGVSIAYAFQPIIDIVKGINQISAKDMGEAILKFPLIVILTGILGAAVPVLGTAALLYTLLMPMVGAGWLFKKMNLDVSLAFLPIAQIAAGINKAVDLKSLTGAAAKILLMVGLVGSVVILAGAMGALSLMLPFIGGVMIMGLKVVKIALKKIAEFFIDPTTKEFFSTKIDFNKETMANNATAVSSISMLVRSIFEISSAIKGGFFSPKFDDVLKVVIGVLPKITNLMMDDAFKKLSKIGGDFDLTKLKRNADAIKSIGIIVTALKELTEASTKKRLIGPDKDLVSQQVDLLVGKDGGGILQKIISLFDNASFRRIMEEEINFNEERMRKNANAIKSVGILIGGVVGMGELVDKATGGGWGKFKSFFGANSPLQATIEGVGKMLPTLRDFVKGKDLTDFLNELPDMDAKKLTKIEQLGNMFSALGKVFSTLTTKIDFDDAKKNLSAISEFMSGDNGKAFAELVRNVQEISSSGGAVGVNATTRSDVKMEGLNETNNILREILAAVKSGGVGGGNAGGGNAGGGQEFGGGGEEGGGFDPPSPMAI